MSEIELKACPFCGGEANVYNYLEEAGAECLQCNAQILRAHDNFGGDSGVVVAASAWNTRAPQWQPIDSAPKTTRSILVWCPERQSQYMVYWDDRYEGEWRTVGGGTVLTESPTKWQPLPAPPEVEG